MNRTDLNKLLAKRAKQAAHKKKLHSIAETLAIRLHVRQGRHLIWELGSGTQKDNIEAIAYWLAKHGHYIEDTDEKESDPLNYLHNKLNEKLLSLELGD